MHMDSFTYNGSGQGNVKTRAQPCPELYFKGVFLDYFDIFLSRCLISDFEGGKKHQYVSGREISHKFLCSSTHIHTLIKFPLFALLLFFVFVF